MAVINDPVTAANVASVGMAAGLSSIPMHAVGVPLPFGTGGAYAISMETGILNAGINQGSELFQFRYVTAASRVCLVHGVQVSAGLNVASSAGAANSLEMVVARGWTAAGTGGTRATLTGNNAKLRTSMATSEVNDIGIPTTSALSAGTKTLDTQAIGGVEIGIGTGALTVSNNMDLFDGLQTIFGNISQPIAYPLYLVNQEGFVIRVGARQMAATMTWGLRVTVFWHEVTSF